MRHRRPDASIPYIVLRQPISSAIDACGIAARPSDMSVKIVCGRIGEHFFDRVLDILVPAFDLITQRLRFLGQTVGHVAFQLAQLV